MTQILPRFYRRELERQDAEAVRIAVQEAEENVSEGATAGGDNRRLRGIPCVAQGVGGVSPGTDPYAATARRLVSVR